MGTSIIYTKIKKFIKKILIRLFLYDCDLSLKDYKIFDDLSVILLKDINLDKWASIFDKLPIKFISSRDFIINERGKLKTMENFPVSVNGHFVCRRQKIRNLEHGPIEVQGNYCVSNNIIDDMTFKPKLVRGYLDLRDNQISNFNGLVIDDNPYHGKFKPYIYSKILKEGNPIGRRISEIDPYGEENWDD